MSPTIQAQNSTLPTTELYTCNGITISSDDILKDSQPTVIVFWKTYDERCVAHISSLLDSRDEVIEEDSLEFIIICVDCIGQTNHIKPFVMGQSWDATVYIDMNGDFKRNMGIVETPMTLMYDADQNLVCQYTGYCSGGDELICEKMKECLVKN
jgi:hypothetical protein